ncbi:hypothetical protein LX36DRAFT_674940 [Colletotrichum falcatum]|nr:hypothetical protein LX36DRAFT_674940 [Colletotrichum falcatum]
MLSSSYWPAAMACVCFACVRRCQARPYDTHEVSKRCRNKFAGQADAVPSAMRTRQTPISLPPLETPHSVAARQEDAEVHVITQTIYRPSTTFVTYVTLGSGPPTSYADGHPDEPPPPPPAPPSTAPPPPDRSSGSLSSVQIGAILGGIVAVVAIVLVAWFCVLQNQERRRPPPDWYGYDSSTEGSDTPTVARPPSTRSHPRDPRHRRSQFPMPQPQPHRPPPPAVHVNHYKDWNVRFNGPARRQQPPEPQRYYRTRFPRP